MEPSAAASAWESERPVAHVRSRHMLSVENGIPPCSDLRPAELSRPSGTLGSQVGPLVRIGQQIDRRIDPGSLKIRIFDAVRETIGPHPFGGMFAGNFHSELYRIDEAAELGRNGNTAACLRLADRNRIDLRE